jgi:RecA-family ATPase
MENVVRLPTARPSTLDSALHLAAQGFRVFPLAAGTKVPPKDFPWRQHATCDPDRIRHLWAQHPNCNVAVATGAGTIVLDVDVKSGKRGHESLEALEAMGLPLDGFRVRTTSGGLHVYLKTDHPHANSVNKLVEFPDIDVRCEGGYVVGPGSAVGGKTYDVVQKGADAPLPGWLHDKLLAATPQHAERTDQPLVDLDQPHNVANAIEYLKNRAPQAIEGAGGNTETYKVAGRMRDYGLSEAKAWELMLDHWNEQKAYPAWEPDQLLTVVENAYRYATGAWGGEDTSLGMEVVEGIPASKFAQAAEGEVSGEPSNDNGAADVAPRSMLRTISAAMLAGVAVPPRAWYAPDLIPAGNVTLLYGDGGTGKSQIALQLAAAASMGEDWLGISTSPGPVLFISAEDDIDELHRRLACIVDSYDRTFEDAADLHLVSLAGEDALLATPEAGRSNILKPTALYSKLDRTIGAIKPSLVVLDTLADLFGGDEIQRAQARQFIGFLRQFCMRHSTTVLLLAHPSLSGINSGTGSSGSTGWSNSVRSRLYLKRADGNADVRVLETQKANYGPVGNQLELRWSRGVFIRHGHGDATANAADELARAEEVFLRLLDAYAEEGRPVSPSPSNAYAPTRFAADKRAEGLSSVTSRDVV